MLNKINKKLVCAIILAIVVGGSIYFSLVGRTQQGAVLFRAMGGKPLVEEQIKFDVADASVFEEIKNVGRILRYKLKHIALYTYEDYYYDTPELDLFKLGYSLRVRIRHKGEGNLEYGIQLKKEYDSNKSESYIRSEADDVIPENVAKDMLTQGLTSFFSDRYNFLTINTLRDMLKQNNVDYRTLVPFLHCLQKRDRFRLKQHSVIYFEISMDDVVFMSIGDNREKKVHFYQLEFENKLKGALSRDADRIEALIKFFTNRYNLKLTRESKYKKTVSEIIGQK